MSLQHLPLTQIREADLVRLIADGIREGRFIDYKRDWKVISELEKKEFLADIASFANAGGGDLVYGIREEDSTPKELTGLEGFSLGEEQLRIEQILKTGISPRLAGVSFEAVTLISGKGVFIIRVPRSYSAPHMVVFGGYDRFFSRHSNGKYQMDVNELRGAFLQSAQATDRIRDFRLERVSHIANGAAGMNLWGKTCTVWHLMPLVELGGLDQQKVIQLQQTTLFPMGNLGGWNYRFNFDGILIPGVMGADSVPSYVQIFRNGCIEAVLSDRGMESRKMINPAYEAIMRKGLIRYLQGFEALGAAPPFFVALSLVNVGGFTMSVPDSLFGFVAAPGAIDRPHLLLPEVAVDVLPASVDAITRPAFDLVWNACGYDRSPSFDQQGVWKAKS
jgi:hypothetical protein